MVSVVIYIVCLYMFIVGSAILGEYIVKKFNIEF